MTHTSPKRRHPPSRELRYYGRAACDAIFRHRRGDIVRIYLEEALVAPAGPLLKWAAAERKAYHIVTAGELEKITESVHHQGICVLAKEPPALRFEDMTRQLRAEAKPALLAYLDGVENPHNLGAIVRTCAHFGVSYVLGPKERLPRLSPSACRVAEGGAEAVHRVPLDQPLAQLRELKKLGFRITATAVNRGESLFRHPFHPRTLLVMGAEVEGVSNNLLQAADDLITIPGTGAVESLNVGVAFGVLAGEYVRQRH